MSFPIKAQNARSSATPPRSALRTRASIAGHYEVVVHEERCTNIAAVCPTYFNATDMGQRFPIPQSRIDLVLREFFHLVASGRVREVEQHCVCAPTLVTCEDGTWINPELAPPARGFVSLVRPYVDLHALVLCATVAAARAETVVQAGVHQAEFWANDVEQVSWYVAFAGLGQDRHFLVELIRRADAVDQRGYRHDGR